MIEPEDLPDSLAAYVTHALAALGEASHSRTSATRSASPVQ
jgi:hypothetical protein